MRPFASAIDSRFDGRMSPRVIQIPLSGGDRRRYVRELKRVEELHRELVRKVAAAYAAADEHLRLAHRAACEEWNARQFIGGDAEPSPLIQHAIDGNFLQLEVRCPQCRTNRMVDLTEVIWPRDKPVHTLKRALYCQPCMSASRRKVRPELLGLIMPEPPLQEPPRVAQRRKAR